VGSAGSAPLLVLGNELPKDGYQLKRHDHHRVFRARESRLILDGGLLGAYSMAADLVSLAVAALLGARASSGPTNLNQTLAACRTKFPNG